MLHIIFINSNLYYLDRSFWWHAYGLSNYWNRKLAPRAELCRLNYNSAGESVKVAGLEPLKLKQFYLAFLLLITGYLLSFIVFMMERRSLRFLNMLSMHHSSN